MKQTYRLTIEYRVTHLGVVESGIGPCLQDNRLATTWSGGFDILV